MGQAHDVADDDDGGVGHLGLTGPQGDVVEGSEGDTLGGVVEVLAYGLPPGLGSHIQGDRRLDARLAADGVHPTPAGYAVMAPLAQRAIEDALGRK